MIGIDTNVLIRLLAADDAAQGERALAAMDRAEASGEPVRLDDVVLAETMWTMARQYKRSRAQLIELAHGLLDTTVFAFERRAQLEEAVHLFEHSRAEFSDCLIVARNKAAGCRTTLTFDSDCARLPDATAA